MPVNAGPETNQFGCNAWGRRLNTESELKVHEAECRADKLATEAGRADRG